MVRIHRYYTNNVHEMPVIEPDLDTLCVCFVEDAQEYFIWDSQTKEWVQMELMYQLCINNGRI